MTLFCFFLLYFRILPMELLFYWRQTKTYVIHTTANLRSRKGIREEPLHNARATDWNVTPIEPFRETNKNLVSEQTHENKTREAVYETCGQHWKPNGRNDWHQSCIKHIKYYKSAKEELWVDLKWIIHLRNYVASSAILCWSQDFYPFWHLVDYTEC
jgi:hypothetical protein